MARPAAPWSLGAAALVGLLVVERAVAGVVAARRFGDPAALLFPVVHLLRDLAWVAAMARWLARRVAGAPLAPAHSMQPRAADGRRDRHAGGGGAMSTADRFLVLVPAHNEADCLPAVVTKSARSCPASICWSSTTARWTTHRRCWPPTASRACDCCSASAWARPCVPDCDVPPRLGYGTVVRIDGDGQHDARDIAAIAGPVLRGEADVVIGTRYAGRHARARRRAAARGAAGPGLCCCPPSPGGR